MNPDLLQELDLARLIFSIKESFYKAYFPKVEQYFGFQDAEVTLDMEQKQCEISLIRAIGNHKQDQERYRGRFDWDEQFIYSAITIAQL